MPTEASALMTSPRTSSRAVTMEPSNLTKVQNPVPSIPDSLSALRPVSWTNNSIPNKLLQQSAFKLDDNPVSNLSKPRVELPGEALLPKELECPLDYAQPVQDQHRHQLVKNANLSAPLLNGWTLFSHQKKAILKGILMRRVILALDMGLGKVG